MNFPRTNIIIGFLRGLVTGFTCLALDFLQPSLPADIVLEFRPRELKSLVCSAVCDAAHAADRLKNLDGVSGNTLYRQWALVEIVFVSPAVRNKTQPTTNHRKKEKRGKKKGHSKRTPKK